MNKFENSKLFEHRTNLLDRNVFKDDHLREIFLEILKNNPGIKVKLYHSKNVKYIVYEAGEIKVEKIKNSKILEEVYKFNLDGVLCKFMPINSITSREVNEEL